MTFWLHSTVLATTIAATAAIGVAGASLVAGPSETVAKKGDRLAVTNSCQVADASGMLGCGTPQFVTVGENHEGYTVLTRMPVAQ